MEFRNKIGDKMCIEKENKDFKNPIEYKLE